MIPRILDMLFLSAPHLTGDDVRQRSEERRRYRFYPRHPRGWRLHSFASAAVAPSFLSTPPSRVATDQFGGECHYNKWFLSTPPSRVATRNQGKFILVETVSIHATLAGGDLVLVSFSEATTPSFAGESKKALASSIERSEKKTKNLAMVRS